MSRTATPPEPQTLLRCEDCGRQTTAPARYVEALGWLYCPACPQMPGRVERAADGTPTGLFLKQPVSRCYPVRQTQEAT